MTVKLTWRLWALKLGLPALLVAILGAGTWWGCRHLAWLRLWDLIEGRNPGLSPASLKAIVCTGFPLQFGLVSWEHETCTLQVYLDCEDQTYDIE